MPRGPSHTSSKAQVVLASCGRAELTVGWGGHRWNAYQPRAPLVMQYHMVRASLTLWLPNDDVGAILGRKGQHLVEIQQSARVTIKISDRAKMENNEREVSITGMYGAVKLAEAMVSEKLNQSRARAAREEGGPSGVPRDE
ncbi:uncharacterized protein HaLaN_00909 [Haematococcus lacustris]|uniref:K Homology domain-containing protein n=1 Tax=Haematococcus lacustris TaxID=44745 RepID=A0A699YT80_HAELA|nr:uncharacterized protein HaLaN_00909 [Haematococcus lacustris]